MPFSMEGVSSTSSNPDDDLVCQCFSLQTVSALNGRTGLPFRPSPINLWSNSRMGVSPGDQHGYWWLCAFTGYLYLQYNYRGRPGLIDVIACYLPIHGTSCWLTAPAHLQSTGYTPTTCILVPGSFERTLSTPPFPSPVSWRQGIEW